MNTQIFAKVRATSFPNRGLTLPANAETPPDELPPGTPAVAWTLEEARTAARLFPRDAYLQYVALQLARNEGRLQEVSSEVARRTRARNQSAARRNQIDLFSILSGQLAVQESLQLDAMLPDEQPLRQQNPRRRTGPGPIDADRNRQRNSVAVADLVGPTIKSHPWKTMLGDESPQVTGLALRVPLDYYFVSFRSVAKLIDATDLATLWGSHLLNQAKHDAQTQLVGKRLQQQLAIETPPLLRPFYDNVVEEVAIVGSDLFLREGSDVTMLFQLKQPALFRPQFDQFLRNAENSRDDVERSSGNVLGVDYVQVTTPDRQLRVFSAYPETNLHVRSNSLVALERVIAAIKGRDADGKPVERLGETDEFRYVRTLMAEGAPEEDGLIYLSDPFVRRLMSPALRLTERRRLVCYNHLRMIGHAGLLHRTQHGMAAQTLAELAEAESAPGEYGTGRFRCPDDGSYSLAADGLTGVCSHHGYAAHLTPCAEIETERVTQAEAKAYRAFVEQYNQYWRQFFDPIAIRLQISPERYRAETIVLPLIDNGIYTALSTALGGEPEPLDALPVPQRNIFSFGVRINKLVLLQQMGLGELIESDVPEAADALAEAALGKTATAMRNVLLAMHNYENSQQAFPVPNSNGLSWRVHLLPYLGLQALYDEFRLDEPWDSDHNRKLIQRIPAVFRPLNEQLAAEGKTKFVVPRGDKTMFPDRDRGITHAGIRDGTSGTIALLEADDLHAVIWTKPEDIELNAPAANTVLQSQRQDEFIIGMMDGSLRLVDADIDPDVLKALLTRAGGEVVDWQRFVSERPIPFGGRRRSARDAELLARLGVGELLSRGVGNQFGFHVYDSTPMFDLSLTQFMGMSLSNFRGGRGIGDDFLWVFPLVGALNGPVYASVPVRDSEIVDQFLDRLDDYLAELARAEQSGGWFQIEQDFYEIPGDGSERIRAYTFRFGPVKWRFFWSRVGDAVYVASQREVIDDLRALQSNGSKAPADHGDVAHAMVRLRPQHWNQVLQAYRLGWEENHRRACLRNLGPLAGLSRALTASGAEGSNREVLDRYAERVYDVHHFCPDAGHYDVDDQGRRVVCSVHGTATHPLQRRAPAEGSELGQMLKQFADLTITLTFLEDGLHAVATIDRAAE